jgi:hypothetical protein
MTVQEQAIAYHQIRAYETVRMVKRNELPVNDIAGKITAETFVAKIHDELIKEFGLSLEKIEVFVDVHTLSVDVRIYDNWREITYGMIVNNNNEVSYYGPPEHEKEAK